ncbi:DUF429 domain-containing protein [Natronorarus salvus]|uniref:DUF429 domain-containing protein n=1 Tax=Natronorarus salvus TaxID=3117733 RepID=UPI002F26CBC9
MEQELIDSRDTVYGIDFSGAKNAGSKIYITEASRSGSGFTIDSVESAADRFDTPQREEILESLLSLITCYRSKTAIFGFDFPFSLPKSAHVDPEDREWAEFIAEFRTEFSKATTPEEFRGLCTDRLEGLDDSDPEKRRETDICTAAQSPLGPQIKHQVYYGIKDLLHPLVDDRSARVLPMQKPALNVPWIVETYPAATLGSLRTYRHGYKNHHKNGKSRRKKILDRLKADGLDFDAAHREQAEKNDDALDSLVCAFAVIRALAEKEPLDDEVGIEGKIIV